MIDKNGRVGHPPLESKTADELLTRLSNDDDFRGVFAKSPIEALAAIGHTPAVEALAQQGEMADANQLTFDCMKVDSLARKEELQEARNELFSHLTSSGNHTIVFAFESGQIAATLRRK
ncbi:MAG TPA: NHLP-related RiPP peptide [Gammaproteobacteria bacterium]|nr:NHLP-related RiPP peptide [Gammaproteobacteria bacterium]